MILRFLSRSQDTLGLLKPRDEEHRFGCTTALEVRRMADRNTQKVVFEYHLWMMRGPSLREDTIGDPAGLFPAVG